MSFKNKFKMAPVEIKAAYISLFVSLILAVISVIFVFFNLYDITLGFILGLLIGYGCYWLLIYQVKNTLSFKHPKVRGAFNYLTRLLCYGVGLVIALVLDHFGYKIFNVYAVAIAYMVTIVTLLIVGLVSKDYNSISNNLSQEKTEGDEENNDVK